MSAIFVRLAEAPGPIIALYRLVIAGLLSLPMTLRGLRQSRVTPRGIMLSLAAGLLLGWHFATWITSLDYTTIAASMTLVTSSPLWLVLLGWLFLKERPGRALLGAVLVAGAGAVLIGSDTAGGGRAAAPLLGNTLALSGALFVSANMLLGRAAQRTGLSVLAYSGITYLTAAATLLPVPALLDLPYWGPYPPAAFFWIAALAVVSQLVGHTALNYALRFLDPTLIATVLLLEPVVASLLGFAVFGELPGLLTAGGATVLLTGVALVVRQQGSRYRASPKNRRPVL